MCAHSILVGLPDLRRRHLPGHSPLRHRLHERLRASLLQSIESGVKAISLKLDQEQVRYIAGVSLSELLTSAVAGHLRALCPHDLPAALEVVLRPVQLSPIEGHKTQIVEARCFGEAVPCGLRRA